MGDRIARYFRGGSTFIWFSVFVNDDYLMEEWDMKKKVLIGEGIGIVVLGAILIMIFLFSTKDMENSTNKNESLTADDLKGTWIVTRYADVPIEDEYWEIKETTIDDFRGGISEAYMSSTYEIDKI